MKKTLLLLLVISMSSCSYIRVHRYEKTIGPIPDEETAKKVAENIWLCSDGPRQRPHEKATAVRLIADSVWLVEGTLENDNQDGVPSLGFGGTASIEIRAKDGKVLKSIYGL